MSGYDWLLFLHVTAAFLILSGAVAIAVLQIAALRGSRPSEIALLLELARIPEAAINAGALGTLVLGIWLARHVGYGLGEGWIVAALVLWAVSGALGYFGGSRYKRARLEAERLAQGEDQITPELGALLEDRLALAFSWGSGAAIVAILVLMVWKPGAG
jgi:uncharacterized membrane protein